MAESYKNQLQNICLRSAVDLITGVSIDLNESALKCRMQRIAEELLEEIKTLK